MTLSNEEIADIIDNAADYMEAHGSTSRVFENDDGNVCMAGSIGKVYGFSNLLDPKFLDTIRVPANVLHRFITSKSECETIPQFNDRHTHQERLDMMRLCAKELRCLPTELAASGLLTSIDW